jgi:hypothetical protein
LIDREIYLLGLIFDFSFLGNRLLVLLNLLENWSEIALLKVTQAGIFLGYFKQFWLGSHIYHGLLKRESTLISVVIRFV